MIRAIVGDLSSVYSEPHNIGNTAPRLHLRKQPSWKRFEAVFVALRVLGKLVLNEMMLVMMKTMANVRIMEMVMRAAGTRKVLTIVTLLMAVLRGIVTMSLFRQS